MKPLKKTKEMRIWDKVVKELTEHRKVDSCVSCGADPGTFHADDCSVWENLKPKRPASRQRLYEIAKKVRQSQSTYPERFWAGSETERTREILKLMMQLASEVPGGEHGIPSDVENICRNLLNYKNETNKTTKS